MNHQQQSAIVWSRLPDLNLRQSHKTARAVRPYELQTTQLSNWTGFEQEVRQGTAPVFGNPVGFIQPVPPNEHHIVANESGVSGRFVENVFEALGPVFEAQGLNFRFGDSPAAIIEDVQAPGRALVVGEFKTPWTRHLDTLTDVQMAKLLGILIL
jgi:hypothetical protein